MDAKNIIFIVSDFDVGGITSSLKNFTDVLLSEGHKVSIINFANVPELPESFNPNIKLLNLKGKALYWNLNTEQIKKASFLEKLYLLPIAIIKKILNRTNKWQRFIFSNTEFRGYDVAVAFRQSPFSYSFVKNNTDAKVKIGFWHGDPDYMDGLDGWDNYLEYVDYIACVSAAVRDKMKLRYPEIQDKMKLVYNIFNDYEIREKSQIYNYHKKNACYNLVTVARIDFEDKQVNFIPEISRKLKENNYDFHWTIVGGGNKISELQGLIEKYDVNDKITLTGEKDNPYPILKSADAFVLTSRCEAYGMVLTEALILGVPCIAAEYPALKEVIDDGKNGIITENSIEGIAKGIENILLNKELYNKLKENAVNFKYDYKIAYNQFMELCD